MNPDAAVHHGKGLDSTRQRAEQYIQQTARLGRLFVAKKTKQNKKPSLTCKTFKLYPPTHPRPKQGVLLKEVRAWQYRALNQQPSGARDAWQHSEYRVRLLNIYLNITIFINSSTINSFDFTALVCPSAKASFMLWYGYDTWGWSVIRLQFRLQLKQQHCLRGF